jgi:hypothetical protein
VKTVDESYKPANVLLTQEELAGAPGDSVVFKGSLVYSYQTRPTGVDEDVIPYEWINDSIIKIDDEHFTIRKLTHNELTVVQDETENGERTIATAYYMR